jgi:hypothetical protein
MTPEKLNWILAEHGHGREWARVFRIGDDDAARLWYAIAQAALDAPISRIVNRGKRGIVCGVAFQLTLNERTATVKPRRGTTRPLATRHVWSRLTRPSNMSFMPAIHEITTLDLIELTEPVEGIPAGARGGVLELRDDNTAMVEITSLPLDSVERIVFVPLAKLRRVG